MRFLYDKILKHLVIETESVLVDHFIRPCICIRNFLPLVWTDDMCMLVVFGIVR